MVLRILLPVLGSSSGVLGIITTGFGVSGVWASGVGTTGVTGTSGVQLSLVLEIIFPEIY